MKIGLCTIKKLYKIHKKAYKFIKIHVTIKKTDLHKDKLIYYLLEVISNEYG